VTDDRPDWDDPDRVARWVARDAGRPAVQTARDLAVAVVGLDEPPSVVVELAAGPGRFLATFLRAFPEARGVWSDASAAMLPHARPVLAPYADRVGFLLTDLRRPGLARAPLADVVVCARATHGLTRSELSAFYSRTAELLRPGGWMVNLDHVLTDQPWGDWYGALTSRFYDGTTDAGPTRTDRGGHRCSTHDDALLAAGFDEVATPWQLLSTVLLMARRPGPGQKTQPVPARRTAVPGSGPDP
jgi:hypothetical protein